MLARNGIALRKAERNQDFKLNLLYWRNQPEIAKWFFSQDPITIDEHKAYLEKAIQDRDQVVFGIYTQPSTGAYHAQLLGTIALYDIDWRNRKAEMGRFYILPSQQGQGYGSLALEILIDYAFDVLGLRKVYCHVLEKNEIAVRMYARHQFKEVGLFIDDVYILGKYKDVLRMELYK